MKRLILLALLLSLGCVMEGGPGRSEYVGYDAEELQGEAFGHDLEKVELSGAVQRGYYDDSGDLLCDGHYFLSGTRIEIGNENIESLEGEEVTVFGTLTNPLCDAPCGCESMVHADRIESQETGEAYAIVVY